MSNLTKSEPVIFYKKYRFLFRNFLREHLYFLVAIIIFCSLTWFIAYRYGFENRVKIDVYSKGFALLIFIYFFSFFIGHALYVAFFIRPDRPIQFTLNEIRKKYLISERLFNAIPVLIFFQIFASCFTSLKSLIPVINPYSWDPFFIQLDATLHFGYQPWELLHPILGRPVITYFVNFLYNLWIFLVPFFLYYIMFSLKDQKLRMQFLLATVGTWAILGGFLATLFSSVGPCFYGDLTGDHDTFQPLMQYLSMANEKFHIFALDAQSLLWEKYVVGEMAIGSGISAMPSMHVSQALLMAIFSFHKNKTFGVFFSVYAIFILIGSVHLAWHYAVDGYLSIILTPVIWTVAGFFVQHIKFTNKFKVK